MSSLDYESFRHPEDVYRGTDFWMLNDALEEDELVRQMREMRERGIVSFIARTYVGLKSDYPGEDFLSKMRVIVGTAKELGMKLSESLDFKGNSHEKITRETWRK